MVDRDRRGPTGLAHRVLGDEHEVPRRVVRHPHRRRRPDLPAPRERDRPVGGGDRQARSCASWLHNAHLQLRGQKMARRIGNIARPAEVYAEGYTPAALRYALIATHYRAPLECGDDDARPRHAPRSSGCPRPSRRSSRTTRSATTTRRSTRRSRSRATRFRAAMDDDLNVSGGLGRAVRPGARPEQARRRARPLSTPTRRRGAAAIRDFDRVLGVLEVAEELPEGAAALDRAASGRPCGRDWAESDRLRDELLGMGVVVEDTRDGQRWRVTARGSNG